MITPDTIQVARKTAGELRRLGRLHEAEAIEALLAAAPVETIPNLDLLTSTQAGELLGVSGQTIKNWVKQGQLSAYRVGGRIMIPRDALAEYVRKAKTSLDLEEVSDEEAAQLVTEGRARR